MSSLAILVSTMLTLIKITWIKGTSLEVGETFKIRTENKSGRIPKNTLLDALGRRVKKSRGTAKGG